MAELGEELRRERVRRNLTFKDVEQVLHIKTTYLEAIEDGNYDIIPGQVYVKGFIRNYGNYLDLDGDRLVKAYQSQVGDIDTFSLRSDRKLKPLLLWCKANSLNTKPLRSVCLWKRDNENANVLSFRNVLF